MNEKIDELERLLRGSALFVGGTAALSLALSEATFTTEAEVIVGIVEELGCVADEFGVDKTALIQAAKKLIQADATTRLEAISQVVKASMEFAYLAFEKGCHELSHGGFLLTRDGRHFIQVDALTRVMNMDASKPTTSWSEKISSWWWRTKKSQDSKDDPEAPSLTAVLLQKDAAFVQSYSAHSSKVQGEIWLSVILFCLAVSAGLLPYLSQRGLFSSPTFTDTYLWRVNLVFPIWWSLVAFGAPSILCQHSSLSLHYAWFSVCFGLLGTSVLHILICHWMLAIEATYVLGVFLAGAVTAFSVFWFRGRELCATERPLPATLSKFSI